MAVRSEIRSSQTREMTKGHSGGTIPGDTLSRPLTNTSPVVPLHAFVLILMNRFTHRLYAAYSSWYVLGTIASMQVPFVEFLPVRTSEHMAALGVFGLVQLVAFVDIVRKLVPGKQFRMLLRAFVVLAFTVASATLVVLTFSGWIAPWTGRFYSLWDTGYAKIHSELEESLVARRGLATRATLERE